MSGYVFVACGVAAHLERLERARRLLRARTARPILVVTDRRRNARPIAGGEEVLDVPTPREWSDRQAAIALKTDLPRLVDRDGVWCYLDTDVLAADRGVDEIFAAFAPPVTCAENLTRPGATLRRFSPYGAPCACREEMERLAGFFARLDAISALHREHDELRALADPAFYRGLRFRGRRRFLVLGRWWSGRATLHDAAGNLRFEQSWSRGAPGRTVYRFPGSPWSLVQSSPAAPASRFEDDRGHRFAFRPQPELQGGGYWEDERGDSFRDGDGGRAWWYRGGERRRHRASDPAGGDAWLDAGGGILGECDHLAEALERDFGIAIPDRRWRAWNGGVFLFSRASAPFFALWRELCLQIFARPEWPVRDQSALVGAAHRAGLADHPLLPRRFNRLVDPAEAPSGMLRLSELREREQVRFVHLLAGHSGAGELPLLRDLEPPRTASDA